MSDGVPPTSRSGASVPKDARPLPLLFRVFNAITGTKDRPAEHNMPPDCRLVLQHMANRAGNEDELYRYGLEQVERDTGRGMSTVRACVAELLEHGYLVHRGWSGPANRAVRVFEVRAEGTKGWPAVPRRRETPTERRVRLGLPSFVGAPNDGGATKDGGPGSRRTAGRPTVVREVGLPYDGDKPPRSPPVLPPDLPPNPDRAPARVQGQDEGQGQDEQPPRHEPSLPRDRLPLETLCVPPAVEPIQPRPETPRRGGLGGQLALIPDATSGEQKGGARGREAVGLAGAAAARPAAETKGGAVGMKPPRPSGENAYSAAWRRGHEKAFNGGPVMPLSKSDANYLGQVCATHARRRKIGSRETEPITGAELLAWIEEHVAEFRAACPDPERISGGWRVYGFGKWLDEHPPEVVVPEVGDPNIIPERVVGNVVMAARWVAPRPDRKAAANG